MTAGELFGRCTELATSEPSPAANRFMHETLVLCCAEGLRGVSMAFGNLFSQVDYLCKQCGMKAAERRMVQQMRRLSNHTEVPGQEEWLLAVRTLTLFISTVHKTAVPAALTRLIPHEGKEDDGGDWNVNARYIRCIVNCWDGQTIHADTENGSVEIDYQEHAYLQKMLRKGMQLNLLDSHVEEEGQRVIPGLVVVEPDFLVDISTVARCFQGSYGHHPLLYTIERLKPRGNSQAMLFGNFAGAVLDDMINLEQFRLNDTLNSFFREQVLQFATCEDFNSERFMADARQQAAYIKEAVQALFDKYDRTKALLEPSFVCERLGLQGRADLMTGDMRLLVEQKSGKNYNLEREARTAGTGLQKEEHYVQLLLYYGILRYNFGRTDNQVDIRLLYSRYPAARGLLYVNFYRELFREAVKVRNQIVATEMLIAREGFSRITPLLTPQIIFRGAERDGYFHRYVEPSVAALHAQLSALSPTERAYYERMMTFVYREQLPQKMGRQEGQGSAVADLWNMPLAEKIETGNIIIGGSTDGLPNFRRGDMVYLYNYTDVPDVRKAILYKGTLQTLDGDRVVVKLNDEQKNVDVMRQGKWAVEHAATDQNTTSAIKSLHQFITAAAAKKDLLLGRRQPCRDSSQQLSRPYHPAYDEVLLHAKQARDYFLLIGPPGTGKTSMALRFMVEEELCSPTCCLLLMAYTNRAVDEICAMLEDDGQDYIRIGNETSCDPRFCGRLLEALSEEDAKLEDIRRRIEKTTVIVGTTSMMQARPWIFLLKHFSLCIVDEASQILEPGLVGLLASDRIDRFILIGDHKQLPAVVLQSEEESRVSDPLLTAIGMTDCRQSLFERLLHWEQHEGRSLFTGILRKQGRMHPEIAAFPNEMFYHQEHLEPVPLPHQLDMTLGYDLPSQDDFDDVLKQQRVMFLNCTPSGASEQAFSDKANAAEASVVADLLRRIHRFYGNRFDPVRTVGVIVPYRNQIAMIRQKIEQLNISALEQISIDTVERYQGSQRDVIIYSFTVSRPYQLDFLTSNCFEEKTGKEIHVIDRKLNVAMTRARKQLLMTGNGALLRRNPIFAKLIDRYSMDDSSYMLSISAR